MMRSIPGLISCFLMICTTGSLSQSTEGFRPARLRAALVAIRQDAPQIGASGAGPGMFVGAEFRAAGRLQVTAGIGILKATDDFMKSDQRYVKQIPSVEIKAEYLFFPRFDISPYVSFGLQACHSVQSEKSGEAYPVLHRAFLLGYTAGTGIFYGFFHPWAFFIEGEYRESFMTQNGFKPVYWTAAAGLSYQLPLPENKRIPGSRDLLEIAEQEIDGQFTDLIQFQNINQSSLPDLLKNYILVESMPYPDNRFLKNDNGVRPWKPDPYVTISDELKQMVTKYSAFLDDTVGLQEFKNGYMQGLIYFNDRNYKASFTVFAYLVKKYSNSPLKSNCYYWLGRSLHECCLYQKAENAFKHAVIETFSTKHPDSYYHLGLGLIEQGQPDAAKLFFREYVRQYPDHAYSHRIREYLKEE